MILAIWILSILSVVLLLTNFVTYKIYSIRQKASSIKEIRMRNRFVLIMTAYEQVAEYLEAMKNSKIFDEMMLEHEPMIKILYEQVDKLADIMWTAFDGENTLKHDLISSKNEIIEETIEEDDSVFSKTVDEE